MGQEIERELSLWSFSTLKTNQEFYILTEKKSYGTKKIFVKDDFSEETGCISKGLLQKAKDLRSQSKVAKVVHDKWKIVYEKGRRNCISEAQGDP